MTLFMATQVAGMMFFMYWCKKSEKGYKVHNFFIKILKVLTAISSRGKSETFL